MNLVLNTFGTSLQKENDMFLVLHSDGKQLISPDKVKSISISKGARISSDAALLALEHEIDVLFVDNSGKPVGRLWSVKYGSISTIRRNQLNFISSPKALEWIRDIISEKMENQVALLLSVNTYKPELKETVNQAIRKIESYVTKVKAVKAESVRDAAPTFRGWEGASSRVYFETISCFMPEGYQFKQRTQHPAADIFNCLLNYGYGILYGKIEGTMIKAGIDPYVGVFHRDEYNRPVLVYDVIERYRVWIDYIVFGLCLQKVINEDCFTIKPDGSYWLEANGKRVLIQSVNDYMEEVVNISGTERSRETHIQLYASALAQMFLKFQ
ncbi:MAG: CRISPR-associated endonuclease Cas1 [Bacteroidales bacterium]|nr:CRISPR-associated endonuclease Cas1 [Bacteroidales bacterium]